MTRPCGACPFRRTSKPGALGGSTPLRFLGHAHGPSFLPCHQCYDGSQITARFDLRQCAGAAIYRANANAMETPGLARLPADCVIVFGTPEEFLAHHAEITTAMAHQALAAWPIPFWVRAVIVEAQSKGLARRCDDGGVISLSE